MRRERVRVPALLGARRAEAIGIELLRLGEDAFRLCSPIAIITFQPAGIVASPIWIGTLARPKLTGTFGQVRFTSMTT